MTPAAVLVSFFLFVLCAVGAAGYAFVQSRVAAQQPQIPEGLRLGQNRLPAVQSAAVNLFRIMGEAAPGSSPQASAARRKLSAAGFRWPSAVAVFLGIKYASGIMLATACAWAAATFSEAGGWGVVMAAVCGLGFGYLLPDRVLDRLAKKRTERLRRALPAAVDLMVLAIEAGQSLDAAIADASRGLRVSHPDLSAEFTLLQLEMRADTSRVDALRNFAARTREPELRKFTGLLIDTDRFGTSLGPALRAHGKYLRTRFRQAAQEKARKVAVKLIFPVFFLIFPSVILVTLGPAAILIKTQMDKMLGL
ncbi:MAG TPA: type II secretion system F family protein [Bryobacteraceae bacterium]|nr:type II secretion system F family protein [Bryobacteraceae bacterium]